MKTIGLIGGMSWESTQEYYRIANEEVKKQLGKEHSAKLILHSVDYGEIEKLQHEGKWSELSEKMVEIAKNLKSAGADFIVICTNTMHIVAKDIEEKAGIEVLHIAEVTAKIIKEKGMDKVALLGTRYTMESDIYPKLLQEAHGIDLIVPNGNDGRLVHGIIYNQLVRGEFTDASRKAYRGVIERLKEKGAQGVILGCTEIPLLLKPGDSPIPVFDTTAIHARAAVEYALQ